MFALPFDRTTFSATRTALPATLEVLLVLMLALQGARLLWIAVTPMGPTGMHTGPADEARGSATMSLQGHGDPFFRQGTTAAAPTDAPDYRLFGVRIGESSSAILGRDGHQRAYAVGDQIAPALTLDAVFSDHVVLLAGNGRHRIELPAEPVFSGPPATTRVAPTLPVGKPDRPEQVAATDTIGPRQLLAQAGLRARRENGEVTGYSLVPRGDGSLLRRAGLRPGDVLLSVNGRPLDPARLSELKQELQSQPRATLTFERDGKTRTLTFEEQP